MRVAWDDIPEWASHIADSILQTVREKDPHTFFHCCRVASGSRRFAKAIGLNEFEQAVMEYSGLFHDVGKVGIPDNILLKADRLNPVEMEVMKTHSTRSAAIVEPLTLEQFFKEVLPGVRLHHERIDGTGYPFGLEGDRIPLGARLVSVVDAYDAMSHVRPYRKPLSKDKVIKELKDFSGTQFDSQLVKLFLEALPFFEKRDPNQEDKSEQVVAKILKAA